MPERPVNPEQAAEQDILEIEKNGLEMRDGRRIPCVVIPSSERGSFDMMIEDYGERVLRPELGRTTSITIQDDAIRSLKPAEQSLGKSPDVKFARMTAVARRLESLQAVPSSKTGTRAVTFKDSSSLLGALRETPTRGGASGDVEGTCVDVTNGWVKKTLNLPSAWNKPALIYLYDQERIERVPEDVWRKANNNTLMEYGFRPKDGKTFADAIVAVIVVSR